MWCVKCNFVRWLPTSVTFPLTQWMPKLDYTDSIVPLCVEYIVAPQKYSLARSLKTSMQYIPFTSFIRSARWQSGRIYSISRCPITGGYTRRLLRVVKKTGINKSRSETQGTARWHAKKRCNCSWIPEVWRVIPILLPNIEWWKPLNIWTFLTTLTQSVSLLRLDDGVLTIKTSYRGPTCLLYQPVWITVSSAQFPKWGLQESYSAHSLPSNSQGCHLRWCFFLAVRYAKITMCTMHHSRWKWQPTDPTELGTGLTGLPSHIAGTFIIVQR